MQTTSVSTPTTEPVDTSRIRGRRKLRFKNFQEVLDEAERLNASGWMRLGNWSLGQVLKHLGAAMHGSIDGPMFHVPTYLKVVGRLWLRPWMLHVSFPPGFKLPRRARDFLVPGETGFEEGMTVLRHGIERLEKETKRVPHPVIGGLSVAQWNLFHLRHAEMHLGFIVPKEAKGPSK